MIGVLLSGIHPIPLRLPGKCHTVKEPKGKGSLAFQCLAGTEKQIARQF